MVMIILNLEKITLRIFHRVLWTIQLLSRKINRLRCDMRNDLEPMW